MDARFGERYSRSVAQDLVIAGLGGRTVDVAVAEGMALKAVWVAVCEAVDVPVAERH